MKYDIIITLKDPRNDIMAKMDLTDRGNKIFVYETGVSFEKATPFTQEEKTRLVEAVTKNPDVLKIELEGETLYNNIVGAMK